MDKVKFTKMHGCGNDYIYVDAQLFPMDDPSEAAIAWSDRHKGIGSDGLVLIGKSTVPEADFSMRIFNADGSEAMMCGNASRCIGKYVYERGLTQKRVVSLLTLSGIKTLYLHIVNGIVESVTVDMGEPVLEDESLFDARRAESLCDASSDDCQHGGESGVFVSMGNPHYVIFTDDVDQVGETGPVLERHPAFPLRCNIEFARQGGKEGAAAEGVAAFRTRVWERGSGITMACGTGACATAVAACLTGRAGRKSNIVMDGGTLNIEWCESDHTVEGHIYQKNHVYMTGPAEFVFDGEIAKRLQNEAAQETYFRSEKSK